MRSFQTSYICVPFRVIMNIFPALEILLKGIILGLTVSMPLGPIGIILVNRTLKRGILSGLFSGMGLATADTILSIIAGIGFTFVITFFQDEKFIVSLIAGLVIIGVGIKVFISNPVKDFRKKEKGNKSLLRDYFSILILALSNPFTIFIFVAFFSGITINISIGSWCVYRNTFLVVLLKLFCEPIQEKY
jgi:threonine/homoserine/homoserine lactone efflux protein